MSKDAKKKVARVESWKDERIKFLSDALLSAEKACESAAAGAAGLLTRAEAAEADLAVAKEALTNAGAYVSQLLSENEGLQAEVKALKAPSPASIMYVETPPDAVLVTPNPVEVTP